MARWSAAIQEGQNPLSNFVDAACQAVNWTIEQGLADAEHLGVAGLSRGAYIATHLAAKDPRLRHILGFAPLTDVSYLKEFSQLSEHPLVAEQKLNALIPQLLHHKLRFYIGNRDLRVGTERCFDFVHKLADAAYSARVRSPQAELFITPSIGHRGHGTSPMTFFEGAQWLREELQASSKHPWL
jgi:esterase FrsA